MISPVAWNAEHESAIFEEASPRQHSFGWFILSLPLASPFAAPTSTHTPLPAMPVRKLHALAAIPCSLVLAAARRRDALLRERTIGHTIGRAIGNDGGRFAGRSRLPSLAILSAVAGLSSASLSTGCVAVGGSRKCEPPTLGKQLIDLKAARDAGALTEAEYDAAKSRMLASEKSGDMTCGKPGEK